MEMKDYINDFTNHLTDAINIGNNAKLKPSNKQIKNILICGLGGSGIGGEIVSDILVEKIKIPIIANKNYCIPSFVSKHTLVIANSYSGNTEETLAALQKCKKKDAEIAIITSGGSLQIIAKKNNYNRVFIPSGHPPRAMLAYSFTQIFYILNHYNIISDFFKADIKQAISLLDRKKDSIQQMAMGLAKKMFKKTPVIYVSDGFEGVAIRFRQQINENSKMLCWHHVIPEMNHNELLGWRTNVNDLAVIYFRNNCDHERNQVRIDINKQVIGNYTNNISEVWSEGDTLIEKSLYHINLGDWVSWYLSQMNNVDAIEINVINFLKNELAKLNE